jgi:hypothetical protein
MKRLLRCLSAAVLLQLLLPSFTCWGNLTFGTDAFSSAPNFTGSLGLSPPTNIENYTTEAFEPGHRLNGSVAAGKTAWWRWTAPEDGFVSINTLAAIDDQVPNPVLTTVMAVYTGTSLSNLQRVTANEDYWLIRTGFYYSLSNVAFFAIKGTTYRIAVDGYASPTGNQVQLHLRHLSSRRLTRQAIWGNSSDPNLRGSLSLTQTLHNQFSAVLTMGRRTIRFRGSFDIEGYYRMAFERPTPRNQAPLPPVQIEIDGVAGVLRTHDSIQTRTYTEFKEVVTFSATSINPVAGYYTAGAGGTGFVTATIAPSGLTRGNVRTPDGATFTFSSRLTRAIVPGQFYLPILRILRNGTGFWSVRTRIIDAGVNDDWLHDGTYNRFVRAPAPGATYYPNGVDQILGLSGGTYNRPSAGQRALGFLNGSNGAAVFRLIATLGELSGDVAQLLTFSTDNRFTFLNTPLRPTLSFNPRTGLATGGITLAGERRRTLRGILSRSQNIISFSGYATGQSRTVRMSILPP